MGRLIDTDSLKDRASEYTLNEDEYRRFCEIIDAEPTAFDLDKDHNIPGGNKRAAWQQD